MNTPLQKINTWLQDNIPSAKQKSDIYHQIISAPLISPFSTKKEFVYSFFSKKFFQVGVLASIAVFSYHTYTVSADFLPGDLMYPVKIAREQVRYFTQKTPAEKIAVSFMSLNNRLREHEILAQNNQSTVATEKIIERSLNRETERIQNESKKIEPTDSFQALTYQNRLASFWEKHTTNLLASSDSSNYLVLSAHTQTEKIHKEKIGLQKIVLETNKEKAEKIFNEKIASIQQDTTPTDIANVSTVTIVPALDTPTITTLSDTVSPEGTEKTLAATAEPKTDILSASDVSAKISKTTTMPTEQESITLLKKKILEAGEQKQYGEALVLMAELDTLLREQEKTEPVHPITTEENK